MFPSCGDAMVTVPRIPSTPTLDVPASRRTVQRTTLRFARPRPVRDAVRPMRLLLLGSALALLAACAGGGTPSPTPADGAQPTAYSSLLLEPMNALPSCPPPPEPIDVGEVEGLVVPDGTVLRQRNDTERLIQVVGYVPLTPVQTLAAYEDLPVDLLMREHEQFESELVYETDTHRAFVKTQVHCATGSNIVAVVAQVEDAGAVPTPSGAPAPSPTS